MPPQRPAQAKPPAPPPRTNSSPVWVPAGGTIHIGRQVIAGGMVYFGTISAQHLSSSRMVEVIDPSFKVDFRRPDRHGTGMSYWPAYHSISPTCRAGYLTWLAEGRWDPDVYIGYVFLFFYGLEQRALVDSPNDPVARAELPQIFAEVTRLLGVYSSNNSFRGYATKFQDTLRALLSQDQEITPPEPSAADRFDTPMALKLGVGRFARDSRPVPVEWAYSWALLHPEIYPRTPAVRCPDEFRRLFALRYRETYGEGMLVRSVKRRVTTSYRPASASLARADVEFDVPDVITSAAPTRKLAELVERCTTELDAYSRLIGRDPEAAASVAAVALLPADLLDASAPALQPLQRFLDRSLADGPSTVDAAELTALWPARTPGKFGKADAVGLAQLLERFGIGVEPDVRMGGPVVGSGPAVLFRATHAQPTVASPEYTAATTLLHLAAVVSAADNDVSDAEREHLVRHLESALHLSEGERERLTAHLTLLLAADLKLTGLKKRLAVLAPAQRQQIGEFLTMVAAIDGHISPEEVKSLRKIYTLLELDPETVYGTLHVSAGRAATPAATEPITVRAAQPGPSGYLIPPPPDSRPATGGLALDPNLIEARLAESAAVSALLTDLFADDSEDERLPTPAAEPLVPPVGGLDATHSAFARKLAERPVWTREELSELCDDLHLMVDGALDTVNEAALDLAGEPLLEDGDADEYQLNDYARGELLG